MSEPVLLLHPGPSRSVSLEGLYLELGLRDHALGDRPFVYTNFLASLDGRIAVAASGDGEVAGVPRAIANPRDWRLYQELAIQADVIVVGGRYLRELAAGVAGPLVTVGDDAALADMRGWRHDQGMPALPAVVVVSGGLHHDVAPLRSLGHEVIVAVPDTIDRVEAARIERDGTEVVVAGERRVEGLRLVDELGTRGHRTVFSGAGPGIMRTLVADDVLDVLFVTIASKLLGGDRIATLLRGDLVDLPFGIDRVYLDTAAPDSAAQLFLVCRRTREDV